MPTFDRGSSSGSNRSTRRGRCRSRSCDRKRNRSASCRKSRPQSRPRIQSRKSQGRGRSRQRSQRAKAQADTKAANAKVPGNAKSGKSNTNEMGNKGKEKAEPSAGDTAPTAPTAAPATVSPPRGGSGRWGAAERDDGYDTCSGNGSVTPTHGVKMEFVCGRVPVVTLDTDSVFHGSVSLMLQAAVSSGGKVDSLFEYCEDADILAGCRSAGHRADDIMVARVIRQEHVRAVGASGKRSIMLALVVALALDNKKRIGDLWELMESCNLSTRFAEVLRYAAAAMRKRAGPEELPAAPNVVAKVAKIDVLRAVPQDDALVLNIVCANVPVTWMGKEAPFHKYASWLLQEAMGSESKAEALYEYNNDKAILGECRELGYSKEEVSIVRLKKAQHIRAVAITGKRAAMVSLVIALALHDALPVDGMLKAIRSFSRALEKPFLALVRNASNMQSAMPRQPQDELDVQAFLADLKLDRYYGSFLEHGFDCMEVVHEMQESHMQDIGMAAGHTLKLRKRLVELGHGAAPAPPANVALASSSRSGRTVLRSRQEAACRRTMTIDLEF